jgi:uncharacterized protein (DUF2062 family)
MTLNGSPHGIAAGFALGLGLSLIPIPFAGMFVALALAPLLGFNVPATYLGSAVVNPFTGPIIYFSELWLGATLMSQDILPWDEARGMSSHQWWDLFRGAIPPFLLGGAVLATCAGTGAPAGAGRAGMSAKRLD